jgi:hypothetical protein
MKKKIISSKSMSREKTNNDKATAKNNNLLFNPKELFKHPNIKKKYEKMNNTIEIKDVKMIDYLIEAKKTLREIK